MSAGTRTPTRELIVLVLVDAMRPDHLGAYGYTRPTSPNLDRFAATGARFSRVYANAPWTRPSSVSFLTGLNASRHRTQSAKERIPDDVVTIAERLRKAGYATAGFTANGNGGSLAGLQRGFDVFEDPSNTYTKGKRGHTYNGLPSGPFLIDRVLAHLRASTAKREFVFVFLVDPHDPYNAPPELEAMFLGDFKGTVRRKAVWETNNNYPPDERFSMVALYDAGIRYADQALGSFFAGLQELGLYDNATIFVSADHGEAFGEHGVYLHAHHFYDEIARIPLLARGPSFPPAKVDDRLTQAIDVAATIVELAGADSSGLAGHSLLQPAVAGTYVVSEYNEFGIHRQAIISPSYKVIWQRAAEAVLFDQEIPSRNNLPSVVFEGETVHVFDMVADPSETTSMPEPYPAAAADLLTTLRAFVGMR